MQKLVEYIDNHFKSISAFARSMGVAPSTVKRWIDGSISPTPESAMMIERATKGKVKAKAILLHALERHEGNII